MRWITLKRGSAQRWGEVWGVPRRTPYAPEAYPSPLSACLSSMTRQYEGTEPQRLTALQSCAYREYPRQLRKHTVGAARQSLSLSPAMLCGCRACSGLPQSGIPDQRNVRSTWLIPKRTRYAAGSALGRLPRIRRVSVRAMYANHHFGADHSRCTSRATPKSSRPAWQASLRRVVSRNISPSGRKLGAVRHQIRLPRTWFCCCQP
jgi:hypothetical protein